MVLKMGLRGKRAFCRTPLPPEQRFKLEAQVVLLQAMRIQRSLNPTLLDSPVVDLGFDIAFFGGTATGGSDQGVDNRGRKADDAIFVADQNVTWLHYLAAH